MSLPETASMAPVARRMKAADRRENLLDHALSIVTAEAFTALTMERLAREAGVTRAVVYAQFPSLDEAILALVDRETHRALASLTQMGEALRPTSAAQALNALIAGTLSMIDASPKTWHVMLNPPDGGPPVLKARIEAGRAFARMALATYLQQHLFAPLNIACTDAELTDYVTHLVIEDFARQHLRDPVRFNAQRLEQFADWLQQSLLSRPIPLA